eukprot:gene5840-6537_t
MDIPVVEGMIAVIRKGQHFARQQISMASMKYRNAIQQNNDCFHEMVDESNDGDAVDDFNQHDVEFAVDSTENESLLLNITTSGYNASTKHKYYEIVMSKTGKNEETEIIMLSGHYFVNSTYKLNSLERDVGELVSQMVESVIEGRRLNQFISQDISIVDISISEAVAVLAECNVKCSIALESDVFLEDSEDENLLLFHLQRLTDFQKRYAVVFITSTITSLFLLDGSNMLYVDIHMNNVDSIPGGAIILKNNYTLRAFYLI